MLRTNRKNLTLCKVQFAKNIFRLWTSLVIIRISVFNTPCIVYISLILDLFYPKLNSVHCMKLPFLEVAFDYNYNGKKTSRKITQSDDNETTVVSMYLDEQIFW